VDFGLLWYDDSSTRSLADKVARAAAQYEHKFGQSPTVCFVNPAMLAGNGNGNGNGHGKLTDDLRSGSVRVETLRAVLPHHFLVGVEEVRRNGRKRRADDE
jgi:hypothetical protein